VNDHKPQWVIEKVKLAVAEFLSKNQNKTIKDVTVACFGLAFKPDIDDLRESPALYITKELAKLNFAKLLAVEPNIVKLPESLNSTLVLSSSDLAISDADILVMLVDHKKFKCLDKNVINNKIIIDTKGLWA